LTQMKTKGYDSLIFCAPFVILIQWTQIFVVSGSFTIKL
jgi:hypothetical protein